MKPWADAYKKQLEYDDFTAWNNGKYVMLAVAACISKNAKYPTEPTSYATVDEINHDYSIDAKRFEEWAKVANEEFENQSSQRT